MGDAARRVAELQIEQARLARALADAQGSDEASALLREQRAAEAASNLIAEAEFKAAGMRLRAAELEAESAAALTASIAAEVDVDAERMETAKAGTAAAAGGVLCSLPVAVVTAAATAAAATATSGGSASQPLIDAVVYLGGAAASAFLFGLVYRYALRQDMTNVQLKGGVVAAFGLVRGIGQATEILQNGGSTTPVGTTVNVEVVLGTAAAAMGESMLLFGFASVALEFAFQRGIVKPFGGGGGI